MDQETSSWGRARDAGELGALVRRMRRLRGWRQDELARRCDVARMTVSRLERGGDVSGATMVRAFSELGLELIVAPKHSRVRVTPPAPAAAEAGLRDVQA